MPMLTLRTNNGKSTTAGPVNAIEDIGWLSRLTPAGPPSLVPPAGSRVQSAPNPFHPSTVISMDLPSVGATHVEIYDLQGRLVKRLVDAWLPAGRRTVTWDDTDTQGWGAAAGVHFSRVAAAGRTTGQRLAKLGK